MVKILNEDMVDVSESGFSTRSVNMSILICGIVLSIVSIMGPNPGLCAISFISLFFIFKFLYKSLYLSGFLLAFIYQWVQVNIKVLLGTFTFTPLTELTRFPDNIIIAFLLSNIGLVVMTWGIGLTLNRIHFDDTEIRKLVMRCNLWKIVISYFAVTLISSLFPVGLAEFAVQFAAFKWVLYYLIFLVCFIQNRSKGLLICFVVFEFTLGLASYFSSWKNILFYVAVSYLAVKRLTSRQVFIGAIFGVLVIYLGLIWTGVKGDYRTYVGQGGKQVVLVSNVDAISKILNLANSYKINNKVVNEFVNRISYIDYFSSCIKYVPEIQPHEDGKLTFQALTHIITPRVIFRDKAIIDESSHLTKYTGVFYSNFSMGVSFSLGYFGDLYVDFGLWLMMPALFLLGLLIGKLFSNLYQNSPNELIGLIILQISFMLLYKFEISLLKLIGTLTVFWILYRLLCYKGLSEFSNWIFNNDVDDIS